MKRDLPALRRPPEDPALLLVGEQVPRGWQYDCDSCGTSCVVRRRWSRTGNKANGWGVYRRRVGQLVNTFCSPCAVTETRARAKAGVW